MPQIEKIYKTIHQKITEIGRFRGLTEMEAKERFLIEVSTNEKSINFFVKLDGKTVCLMEGSFDTIKKKFDLVIKDGL